MSSIPPHIAQTLVDLRARRDYIDQAIHVLSSIWEAPLATAPVEIASTRQPARIAAGKPVERRQKVRGGSGSDDAHTTTILEALRKTVRPVSVGELKRETKLSGYLITTRLKMLSAKKLIVLTGKTSGTRVSLPGTTPAKEAP